VREAELERVRKIMERAIYRYSPEDGEIEWWTGERWSTSSAMAKPYRTNAAIVQGIKKINRLFPETEPFATRDFK
jgi:hypothetical protein